MSIVLGLMIGIGALNNSLQASGFSTTVATSNCTSINCPAYQPTGCGASSTNCQFTNKTSFTLLNPNSPFTQLFGGDLAGFVQSMSVASGNSGNNGAKSAGLNALSVCETPTAGINILFLHCTSSSWAIPGPPIQQYPIVSCNNLNGRGTLGTGFNASATAAPYSTPSISNLTEWIITGCIPAGNSNTNPTNNTATITMLGDYAGVNGSMTLTQYNAGVADMFGTSSSPGMHWATFLGFVIGIILFVMSFGVGFNAGAISETIGFSSNSQGTKFAQAVGLGLMVWSPIYSEFSGWFSNTMLGWGVGTIIGTILTALYFMGVIWLAHSYF